MGRRALILILSLLPFLPAAGQVRGWAGLPDRILSSTRLGKMSARTVPALPVWDDTPVTFAPDGARPVSADFDFANYLLDNGLRHDALTLVRGSFAPSDTLDYLRGWVLFGDRKLSQASAFLGRVPASSVFYDKSLFYNVVSLANLGDYARAASLLPAARPACTPARSPSHSPVTYSGLTPSFSATAPETSTSKPTRLPLSSS